VFICFEGKYLAEQVPRALEFYAMLSGLVKDQPGLILQTPFLSIDKDNAQVLYVKLDREEHLHAWKNNHVHLGIQYEGRNKMFVDYRLRIGSEVLDSGKAPFGDISTSAGKHLLLWQYPKPSNEKDDEDSGLADAAPHAPPFVWQNLVDSATYVSETHILRISSWPNKHIGLAVKNSISRIDGDGLYLIRMERDYGKYEREEAPTDAARCQEAAANDDQVGLGKC